MTCSAFRLSLALLIALPLSAVADVSLPKVRTLKPMSRPGAKASSSAPALPEIHTRPPASATAPASPSKKPAAFPWRRNIVATIFWIGEKPQGRNRTPNHASSWDRTWQVSYGGYDDPDPENRSGFRPKKFLPGQNPFYVALPYNDVAGTGKTKAEAHRVIPWFDDRFTKPGRTVCKGQWIAVRHKDRICYAQWEDCGPFNTDDWMYVFGNSRPKNRENNGAALDVSPAVRDYLKLKSGGQCDWKFVNIEDVPQGPWRTFGDNNHFVLAQREVPRLKQDEFERLRQQRDAWMKKSVGVYTLP